MNNKYLYRNIVILCIFPLLALPNSADCQDIDLNEITIQKSIQSILDHDQVKKLTYQIPTELNKEGEVCLFYDNGIIPNHLKFRFKKLKAGFGDKEDFFMLGGWRIIVDSINSESKLIKVKMKIYLNGISHICIVKLEDNKVIEIVIK